MKDAKGHGSNTRGGLTPVQEENQPFKSRLPGPHYLGHDDPRGAHAQGTNSTPQLQRRHFEAIAAELKSAPDAGSPAHSQRVSAMADKLATTNPGFRRDFFIKAATGGDYRNKSRSTNTDKELSRFKKANPGFSFGRDKASGQVTGFRKVK